MVESDLRNTEVLKLPEALTVNDLANLMNASPIEVIKELMRSGQMVTINEVIQHEIASKIASTFGYDVLPLEDVKGPGSLVVSSEGEDPDQLEIRPPVVTILGHVDHGKTTLLDGIRQTNVAGGEAGGITQHIGAYQVQFKGSSITFLDTPGHEAFTAMRARGAQVTDVAILVVAADDGIMPQTIEAIDHVKASGVPLIVAINKVDKPDSDIDKVKRQLSEQNLLVEEWGGEVIAVPVSALKNQGVSDLLENILAVAEIEELKANPHREAKGVVVEARIDKTRGTVITVLVQTGTLHIGDNMVVDDVRGRVRAMFNDKGQRINIAGPSQPVEVLGIHGMPQAGDLLSIVSDEKEAKALVGKRLQAKQYARSMGPTFGEFHAKIESGEYKTLDLIIKTDVQGSIDAVLNSLININTAQAKVNVIHAASGSITESNVLLAIASKAIIIGFNSRIEPGAQTLASQEGIEVRFYEIIYKLVEDVEKTLSGLLEPEYREIIEGHATVRALFSIGRKTKVAGIYVNDGRIARDSTIHVVRGGTEIFEGEINTLRRFKDDVREITTGFEGGVVLEGFNGVEVDDILESRRIEEVS